MPRREPGLPGGHVHAEDAIVVSAVVFLAWCFAFALYGFAQGRGWL